MAKKTILVIEDETELRDIIGRVLLGQGYLVLLASSGKNARSLVNDYEGQIDVILVDVILPDGHGRAVAKEICTKHPGCKSIFMSGYMDIDADELPEMNNGNLLQKPFTIFTLARKIREVLGEDR